MQRVTTPNQMPEQYNPRDKAVANLTGAIDSHIQLPENVFIGPWCEYLFFDADILFTRHFVDTVKVLLSCEGSTTACMCNLDQTNPHSSERNHQCIFFHADSTSDDYSAVLRGTSVGTGWGSSMERFGCISDMRFWAIYADQISEMAIIAFRGNLNQTKVAYLIEPIGAMPFAEVVARPPSWAFANVSPERKKMLSERYFMKR